jgi:hypothetical protein
MMQKNEHLLFPLFIDFYGYLFGFDAIHIFDNGSDSNMVPLLQDAQEKGCKINYEFNKPIDFERKGSIIGDCINSNIHDYPIGIPLDCDEFIVLEGTENRYIDKNTFIDYFSSLEDGAHFIEKRYLNNPYSKSKYYRPQKANKLFFKNCHAEITDVGFHSAIFKNGTGVYKGGSLTYFEYHNRGFDDLIAKSKEKMKLRLDVDNLPENYTGGGYHLHQYLKWKDEKKYIEAIYNHTHFKFDGLEKFFNYLNYEIPFLIKYDEDFELFGGDDALFKRLISQSVNYCEYGCGASTLWASRNTNSNIFSVDTSKEWRDNTARQLKEGRASKHVIWIDCGPVKDWGYPIDNTYKDNYILYANTPWDKGDQYDLILIDGRFRVLCFLLAVKKSKIGALILFDDYLSRSHYHVVEKILPREFLCGRQALFIVPVLSIEKSRLIDQMITKYQYVAD